MFFFSFSTSFSLFPDDVSFPLNPAYFLPLPVTSVLSSLPGLCCVVKCVVRHVYRPCFDEKVSLSRQQCWEARYADCDVRLH